MACASVLEGDDPDEAWSSGHLAASVRAVVLLTTAPSSRKRLGRGPFFGKSPRISSAPRRRRG